MVWVSAFPFLSMALASLPLGVLALTAVFRFIRVLATVPPAIRASTPVLPPFYLRSTSVLPPFYLRGLGGGRTLGERRWNGGGTEVSWGAGGEGGAKSDPNTQQPTARNLEP